MEFFGKQPRRKFLRGFLAGIAGTAGLILTSRRSGAEAEKPPVAPETSPILYRRTEEVERYYRTLYYR